MSIFTAANAALDKSTAFVTQQLTFMNAQATTSSTTALAAITALGKITTPSIGAPPVIPTVKLQTAPLTLPSIGATAFGQVTVAAPSALTLAAAPTLTPITIPDFSSSVSINIPDAPSALALPALPAHPTIGAVTIPDAPIITLPNLPNLQAIVIPTFTFPTLSEFNGTAPEFVGTSVSTVLQYTEPTYHNVILDEAIGKIREMWSGGTGLPAAIERAIWERAAGREDIAIARQIADIDGEFSERGFTSPPGMQAARIDAVREEGVIKKLAQNRETAINAAQVHIENTRVAVERGIAAESVLINLFTNQAERNFQAAKFSVQAQLDLYNAQVALFNARMTGYGIQATVYKIKLEGELAKIEVFKAQIEAAVAQGQLNEQMVRIYSAQVQALATQVDIYRARIQGAQAQSEVARVQIEGYKADVEAFAAVVAADKTRFDAYDSRVRGESAKAGIIDAQARGYAALIQGRTANLEGDIQRSRFVVEQNRSTIEAYRANVESTTAVAQIQLRQIEAGVQAYVADTSRFSAQATAETEKARADLAAQETLLRSNLALYSAAVEKYKVDSDLVLRAANLNVEAQRAAGQISSTLAAGAMAAVHIGAQLHGSGNVSSSGQFSQSAQESYSYNVSAKAAADGAPLATGGLATRNEG